MGTWALGGAKHGHSYGPIDDQEALKTITRAMELGCNFFDTADIYGHGHSEKLLGTALRGKRHTMYIATKGGWDFYHGPVRMNLSPSYLCFAVEKSLKRLKTDYIDLYQLHNPPAGYALEEVYNTLDTLKMQGKIRFYGLSIHTVAEGFAAIQQGRVSTIQVVYNLFCQSLGEILFPVAQAHQVGIIAREPLANGLLTGKYRQAPVFAAGDFRQNWSSEEIRRLLAGVAYLRTLFGLTKSDQRLTQRALQFVLAQPGVSVVIPGAKTREQVEENCMAGKEPFPREIRPAIQTLAKWCQPV
jgi:aryl-alcohol dehydrogenase-like predicted oxidoreductase